MEFLHWEGEILSKMTEFLLFFVGKIEFFPAAGSAQPLGPSLIGLA
jgi:hypothetical protein